MARPPVRHYRLRHGRPLDDVVEAETGSADLGGANVDPERIVEARALAVADERLDGRRVHAVLLDESLVAAREPPEVRDPGDLEPDQVGGVVGDALGVRLAEADAEVCRAPETLHEATELSQPS